MDERRKIHECIQEGFLGEVKEFIANTKGMRVQMAAIVVTIIVQVMAFLFMWGGLTTTVAKNTEHLWKDITPLTTENTRNIDKIMVKFDNVKIIGIAVAEDKK